MIDTSKAMGAIAERRERPGVAGDERQHRGRGDRGRERGARRAALGLLPGTLRKANTTFVNLRAALDDLDMLVAESKPATKELDALLRRACARWSRTRGPRSATCAGSSAPRARTTT